jgi:RNA polymerase sigma factor (sigma-70 family)
VIDKPSAIQIGDLMSQVAAGNEAAVEPLYAALWPRLLAYCQRILRVEQDAEDAAQKALLALFSEAPRYEPGKSALGWALSFAYWECRTVLSERRREAARHRARVQVQAATQGTPDPEQLLSERRLEELAAEVLKQFSPDERRLLGAQDGAWGSTLQALSPSARRKRKQRLLQRLREGVNAIVSPRRGS